MRFKDIPDSDGAVVTDDGRVFRHGKEVKYFMDSEGYPRVTIGGKRKRERVHRLVAENFLKGYRSGYQVDHINGIKSDNRAENLEWVSPKENSVRAGRMGLLKKGKKTLIIAFNPATRRFVIFNSQTQAAIVLFGNRNIAKDISKNINNKRMSVRGWNFARVEDGR